MAASAHLARDSWRRRKRTGAQKRNWRVVVGMGAQTLAPGQRSKLNNNWRHETHQRGAAYQITKTAWRFSVLLASAMK